MATYNEQNQKLITCGAQGNTYLCADLKQVKTTINGATFYDIKRRSDNAVLDTVAIEHPDLETLLV